MWLGPVRMWLRIIVFALLGLVVIKPGELNARTYAAIVQDFQTGEILHSRKADRRVYPASLTKMMTLYMLFEALENKQLSLDTPLSVSKRAAGMPASRIGLQRGQKIKVEDAIKALAVKSANDVAVVVAEALAKTEIEFAIAMTERARAMGMSKTTFKNASGLPNRHQKTTARDMAKLSMRLLNDFPGYYHYFALQKFSYRGKTYRSHNNILGSYPGADGLKTGYIRASGFNLAASAKRNGQRLIAIVFGGRKARTRDREMVRLLDLGFSRIKDRAPLIAIGPPKAKPPSLAFAAASPPAAQTSDVARPQLMASKENVAELPIVHAPKRNVMVDAASSAIRPAAGHTSGTDGLETGPAKKPANGRYGVQIGAYHDPEKARAHAHKVVQRLPEILLKGDIHVSGLSRGRRTVYRSRVIGFSKDAAEHACQRLRQIHQECLVVQTEAVQLAQSGA